MLYEGHNQRLTKLYEKYKSGAYNTLKGRSYSSLAQGLSFPLPDLVIVSPASPAAIS